MAKTPLMYGVWTPGQGWLRGPAGVFATEHEEVAQQTARRVGQGAKVYFIDDALSDLEPNFLSLEKLKFSLFKKAGK